ncbi:MAG: hypothetical protein A3J46_02210 [Candidatus Yanofskybacteria bacterium RIFCSPHIGHO2_02_FULL_41_11]|uniref:DUF2238 domain-containing protein n=1 Tax=Candidatus Yanofskybacteria bacterium RIFCSPHIGHO2_02_FULL_41_11 TaxID=1802675 RepID=A0A1F8F8S8_9BACT|nr:MAG: hypothetical protein A3J46_02210 [Candidatus Yanofskybacteria bacterium RIFCSPHIGHO2_02_FULL_41_11]
MKRALIFLIIIFLSNLTGMYFDMYSFWWFDMIHHFLGGFFVAMFIARYLADIISLRADPSTSLRVNSSKSRTIKNYLIIVGAVSFIGVVWEFTEYLASQILIEPLYDNFGIKAYFIGDLDDTFNDLLMDILGAFAWILIFRKK